MIAMASEETDMIEQMVEEITNILNIQIFRTEQAAEKEELCIDGTKIILQYEDNTTKTLEFGDMNWVVKGGAKGASSFFNAIALFGRRDLLSLTEPGGVVR